MTDDESRICELGPSLVGPTAAGESQNVARMIALLEELIATPGNSLAVKLRNFDTRDQGGAKPQGVTR